jgi:hypothetical protein
MCDLWIIPVAYRKVLEDPVVARNLHLMYLDVKMVYIAARRPNMVRSATIEDTQAWKDVTRRGRNRQLRS